jgi:hypothetical protein
MNQQERPSPCSRNFTRFPGVPVRHCSISAEVIVVEETKPRDVLTAPEIAAELRCSKAHVCTLMNGRVRNVPKVTHVSLGRRRVVHRRWLEDWMNSLSM